MTLLLAAAFASDATLTQFETCDAYDSAVSRAIVQQLITYDVGWYGHHWGMLGAIEDTTAEAAPSAGASSRGSSAPSHSGTNNQEQGVDELDFVKTDGNYIYALNGNELAIVSSFPADSAQKVGSVPIDGQLRSLFVQGDRAMVLSSIAMDDGHYGYYGYGGTRATIVDISNRSRPRVLRTLDMDGWMASGRMIGDDAYLVMNANVSVPQDVWNLVYDGTVTLEPYPWNGSPEDQQVALEKRRRQLTPHVNRMLAKQDRDQRLMPFVDSQAGRMPRAGTLLDCSDIHTDGDLKESGLLSVVHVNLNDTWSKPSADAVMGGGWTVYASTDNLYVAQNSSWGWWWWGGAYEPGTDIHKFALNDGDVAYKASGHVDGWLLNQFAMSEHDGHLRVAATMDDWWWGMGGTGQGSLVEVLADDGEGTLRTIGRVDGIAPGEQIYGVRFDGDRGYVVTFRQIDPLHVVDLRDPQEPVVRGELHIPGYSSYLHPIEGGYLLAVGMDGTMNGLNGAVKVSVYDVRDMDDPQEIIKHVIQDDGQWGWSESLWDHHAFTYYDGVLAIPYSSYHNDWRRGVYTYDSGLVVLDIDPRKGIHELGSVSHQALTGPQSWNGVRRSFAIEDTLVSISGGGLIFTELRDPKKTLASVALPEGLNHYYW